MSAGFASTVISASLEIAKVAADVGDQFFKFRGGQNGGGPAADVECVKRCGPPPVEIHFPAEGRQIVGDLRTVGDGVETAVGAFPDAEGDVDVKTREFIRSPETA